MYHNIKMSYKWVAYLTKLDWKVKVDLTMMPFYDMIHNDPFSSMLLVHIYLFFPYKIPEYKGFAFVETHARRLGIQWRAHPLGSKNKYQTYTWSKDCGLQAQIW